MDKLGRFANEQEVQKHDKRSYLKFEYPSRVSANALFIVIFKLKKNY
jgi:hypothetical protein